MSHRRSHEDHIGHICVVMRATTAILAVKATGVLVKSRMRPVSRMFDMPDLGYLMQSPMIEFPGIEFPD